MAVRVEKNGPVTTVIIDRPSVRNAVDAQAAYALVAAFEAFAADDEAHVAVLTGTNGNFCAGADLHEVAAGRPNPLNIDGPGPMGPSRMQLDKPVIAAIAGHAVAGGLELALWCDLRVAEEDATLGVFCRRFGVPLIDGGTVRLPRLIGESRAMDLILTGRAVSAAEALSIGLVNRVVPRGRAREAAEALAAQIAGFPQACMRADRASARAAGETDLATALRAEFKRGVKVLATESREGARRFAEGKGRHGRFDDFDQDW
ncbi:MAG: crotonase/enoyl-CoA hydratase family protein [Myxococcales bacterium]|nr:crotonase/enoyl-CoA hydratase family protein [Myxococcales bacterium]